MNYVVNYFTCCTLHNMSVGVWALWGLDSPRMLKPLTYTDWCLRLKTTFSDLPKTFLAFCTPGLYIGPAHVYLIYNMI